MQRRVVLRDVADGIRAADDVCDAHPDLVRAGIHIGTAQDAPCPVCATEHLAHVSYVFEGKGRRAPGGRAVPRESLERQAERYGDLTVYTVEVCTACHWHHLVESYQLLGRSSVASRA